ncbi:MAG: endonuclease MutS2 [Clostridiales bacterium]|nr:endonuclease MutS2 [Clostridiales bacterium]
MSFTNKTLQTLEFDKICDMLADCALTDGAKAMAKKLMPSSDVLTVKKRQQRTFDAKRLAGTKGIPSFGRVRDISSALGRAEKGAPLSLRELLDIASLLRTTRSLLDYIHTDKLFETVLDEIFERLMPNRHLEEKITRSILSEEMIADEASPALAEIRRKIRAANNRIKDTLHKYVGSATYSKALQENIVTMRNGRYVIPVKIEYKNEIKGLIHDTSSSGATVFVEPMAVVEANNELRMLNSKEEREIERIIAELSSDCANFAEILVSNYHIITELAFIFACAQLAFNMRAEAPKISADHSISLVRARHPLLDKNTAVPINVSLGESFDTLVITGPNTGGKTVTLKTIGLLSLMAQAGLQIPAEDSSSVSVFDNILVDIGDEQSIEQSLSTFSSHMVNIIQIIKNIGSRSLVLFDELGAGTDPVEGAALAIAILEATRDRGALIAATTHYAELKAYGLNTEGVCNASCEFDVETLRPTYKLIIGSPGKSNAFAISEKLGLPSEIVNRAKSLISSDNRRFEYVIEKLEESRIEMERNRDEMVRLRAEYERFKVEAEARLKKRLEESEMAVEKAKAKARQLIEGARASSDYILANLEEVRKKQDSENFGKTLDAARREIRAQLRQSEEKFIPIEELSDDEYILPRPLRQGDQVLVVNIGQRGITIDEPDKSGDVNVQIGAVRMKTNISNLRLIEEKSKNRNKNSKSSAYIKPVGKAFSPELDLRGMYGDDAWFATDKYLDEAILAGIRVVRLIHGKGTGALRAALWRYMKGDKRISSFRLGAYGEGDSGVTVVELK